ncbi:hypothetical protein AB0A70_33980, partial [Streptomyces morookaense]
MPPAPVPPPVVADCVGSSEGFVVGDDVDGVGFGESPVGDCDGACEGDFDGVGSVGTPGDDGDVPLCPAPGEDDGPALRDGAPPGTPGAPLRSGAPAP